MQLLATSDLRRVWSASARLSILDAAGMTMTLTCRKRRLLRVLTIVRNGSRTDNAILGYVFRMISCYDLQGYLEGPVIN